MKAAAIAEIDMTGFRWRFVWPVIAATLCIVALCVFTAVSLFHQQATVTGVLRENVSSRRSASDLSGVLSTLIALESNHIESVADLHKRAQRHLKEVRQYANHPAEQELSDRMDHGFEKYLSLWHSLPPVGDPAHEAAAAETTRKLEADVLLPCRDLEAFNDHLVDETTTQHERVLSQLAWGMAVVAGLGAIAGVVLGFGFARILSRSIRRLRVQLQDAAGKLGSDRPEIVLSGDLGFGVLHSEVEVLKSRIEQVVQELQDREREIVRAEQLAAVGQLAAGVGHEIRNPLTSIKMLVQSGLEDPGQPRLSLEDLRVIEAEIRRMERSLQTFLDFSRPPDIERRPVELGSVIEDVLGLIRGRAEKQHVVARLEAQKVPIILTADAGQLRQVFVNLVMNALDAMPTGGTLLIAARQSKRGVEVEVSDTGPGIARDMMSRLFQPFASNKDTGLGLGLVISRRIVENHGGVLGAGNRPGGGASFFVRLPTGD